MLQYFQDMHLLYEAIDAMPEYFYLLIYIIDMYGIRVQLYSKRLLSYSRHIRTKLTNIRIVF